jgi:hypothetical protein
MAEITEKKPKPAAKVEKINKRIPEQYLFRLLRKTPYVYDGQPVHGAPFLLKSEDTVLWAYKVDEDGNPLLDKLEQPIPYGVDEEAPADHTYFEVRRLRYIPNFNSIFVDEQKGITERIDGQRHNILDNPTIREKLTFNRAELRVKSTEKNLYNFLRFMTQCSLSHPNVRPLKNIDPTYELVDFGYMDRQKIEKGQRKEKAFDIAHTARREELIPHAKFLGIALTTPDGLERDWDAIKYDYKEYALTNADTFLSSFNDPKIKTIYQIKVLSEFGEISYENGTAKWNKTKSFIAQIPNDKEPYDFLASFALTEDGETFANNLKAIYNDVKSKKPNANLV